MVTKDYVKNLDISDPLSGYRNEFLIADTATCYLDGNSLGRLPKSTVAEINRFLFDEWGKKVVAGWADWIDEAE